MVQNIVVGIMGVVVVAAGFLGWWVDNVKNTKHDKTNDSSEETKEKK